MTDEVAAGAYQYYRFVAPKPSSVFARKVRMNVDSFIRGGGLACVLC